MYVNGPGNAEEKVVDINLCNTSPGVTKVASSKDLGLIYFCLYLLSAQRHQTLPRWYSGEESVCQCRRCGFDPWIRKLPWSRKWQPTPVFLPGTSHGQSLVGSRGHMESSTPE